MIARRSLTCGIVFSFVLQSLGAQPFRFTVTADSRNQRANFEHLLFEINRLVGDEGVFHISVGDIDPPQDNYNDVVRAFGSDVVWYPVVGNHEAETPSDMDWIRSHYQNLPYLVNSGPQGSEETTYSFDYGNAHFVVINEYYNGSSDTGTDGDVVDELYTWLDSDLAATTKQVIFVFGHEPAFPFCRHVGDSLDQHQANRDRFWNLLESKKVIAYFCGHTHFYSLYKEQDGFVWQIDVGNAGNESSSTECGPGDGGTFVDVEVTETEVTFGVYRGGFPNGEFSLSGTWKMPAGPAPVANDEAYEVQAGSTLSVDAPGVLGNDVDRDGEPLSALLYQGASHGTVTLNGDGSFTYTPFDGYAGQDSFLYTASDGTNQSAPARVAIAVNAEEVVYTFQQGVNGYSGTVDTLFAESAPNTSYAGATSLSVDADDPSGSGKANHVLLRFEGIVGGGAGQIPPGSNVVSAELTLETVSPGSGAALHRMLSAWSDTDTWNSYGNGVQADGVEARASADLVTSSVPTGTTVLDVTESVQAWVNGEANLGWVFLPLGTDGWDFASSEGSPAPVLAVHCATVAPPAAPTGLSATAVGAEIQLDWDDNTEPSIATYRVYRSTVSGGPYELIDGSGVESLTALSVSAGTGQKPQSKVWFHGGMWWGVFPDTGGTCVFRLDGDTWTEVLQLSAATDVQADCKATGDVTHVLLFRGTQSRLASIEFVPTSPPTYQLWSQRGELVDIPLSSGVETATIDIDSTGRMWCASDADTDIEVRWSDPPYSTWSGPVILESGTSTDDICVVCALPGSVGVLWSNQVAKRFGFRMHADGDDPDVWSADEIPASDDSVGAGVADDHLNVAVASDGTLYAAVKTSYDTVGCPKIALLVRRPEGTWDPLYPIDEAGTRPIAVLNEALGFLRVIYTESEGYHQIVYRETALDQITFGSRTVLIAGAVNDATSTKQNTERECVVAAGDGSSVQGVRLTFDTRSDPLLSAYSDKELVPGQTYWYVVTAVDTLGQESGPSNEASAVVLPQPPQAPQNLSASPVGPNQVDLTWNDNSTNEQGFSIERSPDSTTWAEIAQVGMNVTSYSDTGLSPGTTYYWRVRAYNAAGYSGYSNEASATTPQGNHPPVAEDQSLVTDEDTPLDITLTATDQDGDTLTYSIDTFPSHGVLSGPPPDVTYLPEENYWGPDQFTFHANDGSADSNIATVSITVNPVNDPPVASGDSYAGSEDTTLAVAAPGVLGNDSDPDADNLTAVLWQGPAYASAFTLNADGSFSYTPEPDFWGSDSFTYVANDGSADSNIATVSITVNAVNDPPGIPQNLTATGGAGYIGLDWDDNTEPEGDLQGYKVFRRTEGSSYDFDSPLATVSVSSYTDSAVTSGVTYYYVVKALDTGGLESEASNEASAHASGAQYDAYATADPTVAYGSLRGDGVAGTTASGDGLVQTITEAPSGSKGKASLDARYLLDSPADPASVLSVTLYFEGTWSNADPDDPLRVYILKAGSWEEITSEISTGSYSPAVNPAEYVDAAGDVHVRFTDAAALPKEKKDTLTVDLLYATIVEGDTGNSSPSAVDDSGTTAEDTPVTIDVLANDSDPDGDPLTVSSTTQPANGSVQNNGSNVTYTPSQDFWGTDTFTYTVSDGRGGSATAAVTVTVTAVQDPPVAGDDTASTAVDTDVTIDVLTNDSDPDGDPLTVSSTTQPANGSVQNNGSNVTYTPNPGFSGRDTFQYTVSDGQGHSDTATVTVTVTQSLTVYVADITMGFRSAGPNYFGQATVLIHDTSGAPVEGATVDGTWSGAVSESVSGVTGPDGTVFFESPKKRGGGTFTFTVTGVTKQGYTYDPSRNGETSDSITVP